MSVGSRLPNYPHSKIARFYYKPGLQQSAQKMKKTSDMFPLKPVNRVTRHPDIYEVPFARTSRLALSALPTMARLLNEQSKASK